MSAESTVQLEEGKRLLQAGEFQQAMETLYGATQTDPSDTRPYGYLGMALVRLGDLNNGIAWLQGAAAQTPQDAGAHYNLAVALTQAQRLPEAKSSLETALSLNPAHLQAKAALDNLNASLPAPAPMMPGLPPSEPGFASGGFTSSPLQTGPEPGLSSGGIPMPTPAAPSAAAQGMQYNPAANRPTMVPPSRSLRIKRGLGWGLVCGQWWTAWMLFWDMVHGIGTVKGNLLLMLLVLGVIYAAVFAVAGAIVGLLIGALDSDITQGAIIGAVAGLLLCGLEVFINHNGLMVINAFFWFFTGRFVGRNVTAKVQQPVIP